MKRNTYIGILFATAIVCVIFIFSQTAFSGIFSTIMAFPFEQIGQGLRALSLSGSAGNAVAVGIYVLICLLPVIALLILRKRRKLFAEELLLLVLSCALFAVLYFMVNPGAMGRNAQLVAGRVVINAILGGFVYSTLGGYLIIRILRLFTQGDTAALLRYMMVMLRVLGLIFVIMVFGGGFSSLLDSFSALRADNIGNEHLLGLSYAFLMLRFAAESLPYVMNVLVIMAAVRFTSEYGIDPYSEETVKASAETSRLCTIALIATVVSSLVFNLLQLMFINSLRIINVTIMIPVFSIAFVLAALLLTRFVTENKRLKDDIDSFI